MELIFGGAYQGKTQYAAKKYAFSETDIFTCDGLQLDTGARCIRHKIQSLVQTPLAELLLSENGAGAWRVCAGGQTLTLQPVQTEVEEKWK